MSWESRSGREYYYRVRRGNGVLRKQYVGKGPGALIAAAYDRKQRRRAAAELQERKDLEVLLCRMRLIREACRTVLQAIYLATGYYQTNFRNWRKEPEVKRGKKKRKRRKKSRHQRQKKLGGQSNHEPIRPLNEAGGPPADSKPAADATPHRRLREHLPKPWRLSRPASAG